MSNTPIFNSDPHEVAEDFDASSLLPPRLASSSRQNTQTSITPSVFTSVSSSHTSTPSSNQGESDALAGGNTILGISFGSVPPPNTPAENNDVVSLQNKSSSKSGWTGEYSDPGTPTFSMSKSGWTGEYSDPGTPNASKSKLCWTGEYSTAGVEPEHLISRLSTVANKSEDASGMTQNGEEKKSSDENSWSEGDDNAFTVRDISSENKDVARLARQAVGRVTPRSVMDSLDVKNVKSGVVSVTKPTVQPQSSVLCNIEDEAVPEAKEAVVSSPAEQVSAKDIEFVKGEKATIMGRIFCCARALKSGSKPKPQIPVKQPKHATLLPEKSCLKPAASTLLDATEEESPIQAVSAPKPQKSNNVTFNLDETANSEKSKPKPKPKSKCNLRFNRARCPLLKMRINIQEARDTPNEDAELDDLNSPFASQDLEIQRRLAKAACYREANERTSIIRGSLDFLLVVSDRVDTVASDRISALLSRVADRGLGSYTGEERDHVNPHQYGNQVDQSLYRSKETAMSYLRRRQPRNVIRLGTPWMRDLQ
ncbi:uncharacterized protein BKA55DRAFT_591179 [Fusarium redolens]|uniref:Uncharacterized protein n=1 Tax=Fusarium redolens TaxID=48865 RepID=A0A9P9KGR1_FUSRE|nr:uncharacterized protein BKA55DRAFT_591179 [Fusarium redolens]KAH7260938.1 hypothetical protein BKA55DRAFT_591179 [Fusarium redolens]